MDNLKSIALLIDADNTQLSKLEDIIWEVSTHGRIVVKRAYGNWRKDELRKWEKQIKRLAIKAEQQFDYVSGKNATDMALVIDAMDLLHRDAYDAFAIVSSDSDYTPLAIRLHEHGVYVIGVGEKKTPDAFRNSCDEFSFVENISGKPDEPAEDTGPERESEEADAEEAVDSIEEIHSLLRIVYEKNQDDDGFVSVGSAGTYIKRVKPDFDPKTYGYPKLTKLLEDFPKLYEMRHQPGKGTTIFSYRCREPAEPAPKKRARTAGKTRTVKRTRSAKKK